MPPSADDAYASMMQKLDMELDISSTAAAGGNLLDKTLRGVTNQG